MEIKVLVASITMGVVFLSAFGGAPRKVRVPETLDAIRKISPAAKKFNHVLVVNVGNAVEPREWSRAVTFAASRLQVNLWTNSLPSSAVSDLVSGRVEQEKLFGEKARLVVFVENCPMSSAFLTTPGRWCRVNVRPLLSDEPDVQTLCDRYAKAVLKGCAYAAGSGAGLDQSSVMGFGTMTLKGFDASNIVITPEIYFPMLEAMRQIGGDEITGPAVEE